MITRLHLQDFKNFHDVTLHLGPLTILLGANASGKSNLRDGLRFLHGVARGYTLADTMGGKYGEGGELQWRGLRGGTAEAARHGASTFTMTAELETVGVRPGLLPTAYTYTIAVETGRNGRPRLIREALYVEGRMLYDSHPDGNPAPQTDLQHLTVRIQPGGDYRKGHVETFIANQPVIAQIAERIAKRLDLRLMTYVLG
jgi:hypothetical protein